MTAHTHNIQHCDIATRPNMIFDEVYHALTGNSPAMADATTRCTSRVVSSQDMDADCSAVPVAAPVSPCASEDSDSSEAAASITGRLSDIEEAYLVDARVLGTGHHGSVRECICRVTGKRYAVKSIRKTDPSVKPGGLVREILLLREMNHRSIVQLVDVVEDEEYVHLVTDLFEGGELFDKIVEKSSSDNGAACFTEKEAARIMYQVLNAISYMHKHGVAHRDIKPENIMFENSDEDSPIKIIDFGLARKHFGSYGERPMTTIVGTPYYIAPEVLRQKYDNKCDLWSVGVIAYILLCGYPPFNGGNNEETHHSVLKGRYCFPAQEWKGTTREARDFVRRLLQTDPSKRMTVEQALHHPWMTQNVCADTVAMEEDSQVVPPQEAVSKSLRRPRKGSMLCGSLARRKMRISMFGV